MKSDRSSSLPSLQRPELLAPAGNWECAKAAVENGADAIYFGLDKFNARMRAQNFTEADLPELMTFLHLRGVKGYVTINTLIFPKELAASTTISPHNYRCWCGCGDCSGCGYLPSHPSPFT